MPALCYPRGPFDWSKMYSLALDPDKVDDDELVGQSAAGDERAFAALVSRHAEKVRAVALRYTNDEAAADDIVQEAFWRAWNAREKWQADGPAQFSTWIYRVAVNLCIDRSRKRGIRGWFSAGNEDASIVADMGAGPERTLSDREQLTLVRADIAALPEKQKAALLLFSLGGLKQAEIADTLDISVGAVEQAVARARRTLKDKMAAREGDAT